MKHYHCPKCGSENFNIVEKVKGWITYDAYPKRSFDNALVVYTQWSETGSETTSIIDSSVECEMGHVIKDPKITEYV